MGENESELARLRKAIEAYRRTIDQLERRKFNQEVIPELREVLTACERSLEELEKKEEREKKERGAG